MNSEVYLNIIEGLIGVAGLVVTGVIIPYAVSKVGAANLKRYVEWATIAVEASEKIHASYKGEDKSELKNKFVKDFLKDMFGNKLSDDQINALIESSVYNLGESIEKAFNSMTTERTTEENKREKK